MSESDDRPSSRDSQPGGTATSRRRSGRLRRIAAILVVATVVAAIAGFVSFSTGVAGLLAPHDPRADGIVVLTGGSARIDAALALLQAGRGERLLISGVNPAVGTEALADVLQTDPTGPLSCCIDLGHAARDTAGNAIETRVWTLANGYRSLIVVTGDYHIPRALAELSAAMPQITLIAYPVRQPDRVLSRWWRDPSVFWLMAREYLKLVAARVRVGLVGVNEG
ncbi:MAG: YdcF family protein [Alphaproteobacteria bacterium]